MIDSADAVNMLDLIQSGGIVGLLVYILIGVMRGWWHTDREFKDLQKREVEWKRLALSGTIIAERAVGIYRSEPRARRRPETLPNVHAGYDDDVVVEDFQDPFDSAT